MKGETEAMRVDCAVCGGDGASDDAPGAGCPACGGVGTVASSELRRTEAAEGMHGTASVWLCAARRYVRDRFRSAPATYSPQVADEIARVLTACGVDAESKS
jgi:hypothetical protein